MSDQDGLPRDHACQLQEPAPLPKETGFYRRPRHGWVCFHCGEHFPSSGGGERRARLHFGVDPRSQPACRHTPPELLTKLRQLEANNDALHGLVAELQNFQQLAETHEAELSRLFNGARNAHAAWLELDFKQGQILMLQERLKLIHQRTGYYCDYDAQNVLQVLVNE